MVLPSKRPAKSSRPRQTQLNFPTAPAQASSSSSSRPPALRQASLFQCASVTVMEQDSTLEVGNTLYLGKDEVTRLKQRLDSSHGDREVLMQVLRRLSTMCVGPLKLQTNFCLLHQIPTYLCNRPQALHESPARNHWDWDGGGPSAQAR